MHSYSSLHKVCAHTCTIILCTFLQSIWRLKSLLHVAKSLFLERSHLSYGGDLTFCGSGLTMGQSEQIQICISFIYLNLGTPLQLCYRCKLTLIIPIVVSLPVNIHVHCTYDHCIACERHLSWKLVVFYLNNGTAYMYMKFKLHIMTATLQK